MPAGDRGIVKFLRADPRRLEWAGSSVAGLERALENQGLSGITLESFEPAVFVSKVLARMRLLRRLRVLRPTLYFAALMGPLEHRLFPLCYFNRTVVYCYDCWPPAYDWWEGFFRRHRFSVVMFSARQSADYFRDRLADTECVWVPEATDPGMFIPEIPLVDREIDVLELGRRWDAYHQQITPRLAAARRTHMYEPRPGQVVFPGAGELVEGLANTRVSVLFPSSLTHPERSANVETVTHKYFESMASRCIPIGVCPRELRDLFGYDPLVSIDSTDPAQQVMEILENLGDYQPLVDRNYASLMEVGTWEARAPDLVGALCRALVPA